MLEVEMFFKAYENTAWAFFSFASFLFVCARMYDWAMLRHKDKVEADLRMRHQSTFFDLQEARYSKLVDSYIDLEKRTAKLEAILLSLRKKS